MNITSRGLTQKADELANRYNVAANGENRDKIKAEWYKEVKKAADLIRAHSTFLKKSSERKLKNKKSALNRLKVKK